MVNIKLIQQILETGARKGGEVLRTYFQKELAISHKSGIHDIVTLADQDAQKAIVTTLKKSVEGTELEGKIGFIGEEGLFSPAEYTFVIDPLDGTSNFASCIDYFSVSIALFKENEPIGGAVYHVMNDRMYSAVVGEKALLNGQPFMIPRNKKLEGVYAISNLSKKEEIRKMRLLQITKIFPYVRSIRVFGSIALDICQIAVGQGDITWAGGSIWDISAAEVIITAAGGEVLRWDGGPIRYNMTDSTEYYQFIAGEKELVAQFLQKLNS